MAEPNPAAALPPGGIIDKTGLIGGKETVVPGLLDHTRKVPIQAIIFHHTTAAGVPPTIEDLLRWYHPDDANFAEYFIDRSGTIYKIVRDGYFARQILPGTGVANGAAFDLKNGNTIGVEISASSDGDVLPVQ